MYISRKRSWKGLSISYFAGSCSMYGTCLYMCVCNIRVVLLNCMRLLPGALMKNACHLGLIWKICACLSKFIDRFSRWLLYRYILLLGKLYYLVLWLLSFISVPFCTHSQASFVFVFTFMFNRVQLGGHLEA